MGKIRLYLKNANLNQQLVGKTFTLNASASNHIRALRGKIKDNVELFNGDGYNYLATISSITKVATEVIIIKQYLNQIDHQSPYQQLHLYVGLTANDTFHTIIQKATELGAHSITPLITEFSQRLAPNKQPNRLDRWYNIAASASEQCGSSIIPAINLPMDFKQLITHAATDNIDTQKIPVNTTNDINSTNNTITTRGTSMNIIASPLATLHASMQSEGSLTLHGNNGLYHLNNNKNIITTCNTDNPDNIILLVGAEGGFSLAELALAMKQGFSALTLSRRILRSDTATVSAISKIYTVFNWW